MASETLATKYRPHDWKSLVGQDTIRIILQEQLDTKTFKQAYLFCGPSGDGKAQPLDSLVLTPNGYKRMGDISIGDSVVDGLGKKTYIQGIFPQGKKDVYKVSFNDNSSALCSDEHLWKVVEVNKNSHLNKREFNTVVLTTNEIKYRMEHFNGREYRIPTPTITAFEHEKLPIDPYLLGILIADGSLSNGNFGICVPEDDIKEKINTLLYKFGMHLVKVYPNNSTNYDYHIQYIDSVVHNQFSDLRRTLKYKLDKLGLLCKSVDKHIPKEYLFSTVENRWSLLQGLYDGDGYTDKQGNTSFSTSSKQLSDDFAFLVRSLGATDSITSDIPKYKKGNEIIECTECFTHYLKFNRADLGKWCSSIKHKDRLKERQHDPIRKIVSIEYIGKQECQCIYVSSTDHTYITDNIVVTHNTTCARIFANEINHGQGGLVEIDAASHNSVDDVRDISQQAKTQSLNSEYKIFLCDEVHSFSSNAWQAMLKLIEEPPERTIFIFCTTNPEKIPKTILSRVQRYDFSRISQTDIANRLAYILHTEKNADLSANDNEAIQYISRIADGGMRTAISYLDKCLSYSEHLSVESVIKALGIANYDVMFSLFDSLYSKNAQMILEHIESLHKSGLDLKQFIRSFMDFILDICKYGFTDDFSTLKIPNTYETELKDYTDDHYNYATDLLSVILKLNSDIKWDANPKSMIEAELLLHIGG